MTLSIEKNKISMRSKTAHKHLVQFWSLMLVPLLLAGQASYTLTNIALYVQSFYFLFSCKGVFKFYVIRKVYNTFFSKMHTLKLIYMYILYYNIDSSVLIFLFKFSSYPINANHISICACQHCKYMLVLCN